MKKKIVRLVSILVVGAVPVAQVIGACLIQKPGGSPCQNGIQVSSSVFVKWVYEEIHLPGDVIIIVPVPEYETVSCPGQTSDVFPDIDLASTSGLDSNKVETGNDCHYTCTAYDSELNSHDLSVTPGNARWIVTGNQCTQRSGP